MHHRERPLLGPVKTTGNNRNEAQSGLGAPLRLRLNVGASGYPLWHLLVIAQSQALQAYSIKYSNGER